MGEPFDELKRTVADTLAASGVLQRIKAELRVGVFQALDESGQVPDKYYEKVRTFCAQNTGELSLLLVRELLHHAGLNFTAEVFNVESALENVAQPSTSMLADKLGLSSFSSTSTPTEPLLLHLINTAGGATATAAVPPPSKAVSASVLRIASRAFSRHDKGNTNSLRQPDAVQLLTSFFPTASRAEVREAGTAVGVPFDRPSARVTFEDFLAAFVELSRSHDADTTATAATGLDAAPLSAERTQAVGGDRSEAQSKQERGTGSTAATATDHLFSKYFAESGDEVDEDTTAKQKQQQQQQQQQQQTQREKEYKQPQRKQVQRQDDTSQQQQPQRRKRSPPKEQHREPSSPPSASKSPTDGSPTGTTTRRRGDTTEAKGRAAAAATGGRRKKDKASSLSSLLGDLPGLTSGVEPKRRSGRGAGLSSSLDDLFGSLDTPSAGKGKGDKETAEGEEAESPSGVGRETKKKLQPVSTRGEEDLGAEAKAGIDPVSQLLQRKPQHTASSKPSTIATREGKQAGDGGDSYQDDFVASDDSLADEVAEEELSVGSESAGSHRSGRSAGSASHRSGRSEQSGGSRSGGASREDTQRLAEINARLAELEGKRRVGPAQAGQESSEPRVGGERGEGGGDFDILDRSGGGGAEEEEDDGDKTPVPRSGSGDDDDLDYEQDFEEPSEISEDILTEDISEHLSDLSISHGPDSQRSRGSAVTEDYSVGSNFSNKDFLFYTKP